MRIARSITSRTVFKQQDPRSRMLRLNGDVMCGPASVLNSFLRLRLNGSPVCSDKGFQSNLRLLDNLAEVMQTSDLGTDIPDMIRGCGQFLKRKGLCFTPEWRGLDQSSQFQSEAPLDLSFLRASSKSSGAILLVALYDQNGTREGGHFVALNGVNGKLSILDSDLEMPDKRCFNVDPIPSSGLMLTSTALNQRGSNGLRLEGVLNYIVHEP